MWNSSEMKYERLILLIWDTEERMSDPFGLGDADIYVEEINQLGKRLLFGLEAGLRRLKYKFEGPNYSDNDRAFLKETLQKFSNIKSTEDVDYIIDEVLNYLEKNKLDICNYYLKF